MTQVTVEVADLVTASRELARSVAEPVHQLVGNALPDVLAGGGMAGDDPAGAQWSAGYDRAAPEAIQAAEDVINSCFRVSAMLAASARNYAHAEVASTVPGHPVDPTLTSAIASLPSQEGITLASGVPPASAGAGSGHTPPGWHFIAHRLGGYVWPNGHQDRLRRAAAAWRSSASALEDHATAAAFVDLGPLRDRLPEGADIATVCNQLCDQLHAVARAHRGLARACSELAAHIDHAHTQVEHELVELIAWTGGIEAVGALASVFTAGIAEAPTQAGEAARIAATVTRVIEILRTFLTAVREVLAEIGSIAGVVADARAAVAWLKDLRIVEVEVTAVPGLRVYQVARVERTANEVAATTEVAAGEEAALERLAAQSEVLPKPNVTNQKLRNIVGNLYKHVGKSTRTGDGTTSAAIRREISTGEPTGGRMHITKGQESVRGLTKWLRDNPDASASDQLVARSLLDDLRRALGGD